MRILFITPRFPYPPVKGDRVRPYNFIKELSRRHTIDLCSFYETKNELGVIDEMKRYCNKIEVISLHPWQSYANLLKSVINLKPLQVNYYHSLAMVKKIEEMISSSPYDIIHVVLQRMMEHVKEIPADKIVLDQIDALSLNMQRRAFAENNPIKKAVFYMEYANMKRYERGQKKYAACIITSEKDKQALGDDSIQVIPNGVDIDYFTPAQNNKDIDLIFTGNMGYFPNVDSVLYLCNKILPKILLRYPSLKLYIVGTNPAREVQKLADNKNIFVTGFVDDIRQYLNRTKVFVAPLRSGSGIQNKILEAMACGLPVVTTSYGNAAIKAKPDQQLVIMDEPNQFADKVIDILNNESLRKTLGANARAYMEQEFSWLSQTNKLEQIYDTVQYNRIH